MFPAFVRGRALDLCLLAALLATSACASRGPGTVSTSIPGPVAQKIPDAVAPRRKRPPRPAADSAALELAVTKRLAHRPLALALTKRTQKPELADRAAFVVVQEAKRLRMSPSLLAAVLLIENARLDSTVVSTQGAIGMMQVMPVHAGSYGCSSSDLLNLEANICHGARLLKTFLRRSGDMQVALRRYNGCVRGRHTPRCHRYPVRVLRTASRLRREILVSAAAIPESASPEIASSKDEAEVGDSISGTESGAESAGCGSFFACLRYKWSAPR
jgi:soluble lytic murein transglycosylase-like protein